MSIFTVTIGADTIEVYVGFAALTSYFNTRGSPGAVAFRALAATPDDQKRLLVDATSYFEQMYWQGVATGLAGGVATTLSFPRTGLTDVNGAVLDAANVPAVFASAVCEMVGVLAVDNDAGSAVDGGSNVAELGAGSGRVRFFRPLSALTGDATVLSTVVDRLVGRWLAAAGAALSAAVAGVSTGGTTCCSTCNAWPCCCTRSDVVWPL